MKKVGLLSIALLLMTSSFFGLIVNRPASALSGSEFQAGRIIDDAKFFASSPMTVADIQTFLNAKLPVCDTNGSQNHTYRYNSSSGRVNFSGDGSEPADPWVTTTRAVYGDRYDAWYSVDNARAPYTCLKDYLSTMPAVSPEADLCNGITASGATAADIIYWVGQSCGVNPQVLIVLLQKEQSLVTDDWPWKNQYKFATGFCVYDTGAPPPNCNGTDGFFNQVYYAARQFKKYKKSPNDWNFRGGMNANIQYNVSPSCGSSTVFLQNQATAGLYNYTPYQPNPAALDDLYGSGDSCSAYGNRNFWRMFNDWFGSTFGPPDYSCGSSGANIGGGVPTGQHIVPVRFSKGGNDSLRMAVPNNTATGCIEVHTWYGNAYQQWLEHTATNWPSIHPVHNKLLTADRNGDGRDELYMVNYTGTSSGMIEVHGWTSDNQHWASHTATNRPTTGIDATNSEVIAADTNGDGIDELYLVQYNNTASGRTEVHRWSSNLQQWVSHIATNYGQIDPKIAQVIAADTNGDGTDEFLLINYSNTGSGRVEVHTWSSNFQQWVSHIATNRGNIVHMNVNHVVFSDVISADTNGDGTDELLLAEYIGTNSGRTEVHGWAPGYQQWVSHIATSQGTF